MEAKTLNRPTRTRAEIIAWLQAARERKAAWEKRIEEKWAMEDRQRKAVAESHYYDIEWA